ncbi:MAG: energy transducer TonB [Gemmatimonadota bacterium]
MNARPAVPTPAGDDPRLRSANDRFKAGSRRRNAAAIALAVAVHALIMAFGPEWRVEDLEEGRAVPAEFRAVNLVPEVEMPAAPGRIAPPPLPVVNRVALNEDVVIEPEALDFGRLDAPALPEPPPIPEEADEELEAYAHFMPYMVRPELKNRAQIQRELERRYPEVLRHENVEGAVVVLFWIDEFGKVQKYEIRQSSGSKALDAAVESVIDMMEFRPAIDHGRPVRVIVALPIRFQIR